jgi:hypothetical protein
VIQSPYPLRVNFHFLNHLQLRLKSNLELNLKAETGLEHTSFVPSNLPYHPLAETTFITGRCCIKSSLKSYIYQRFAMQTKVSSTKLFMAVIY